MTTTPPSSTKLPNPSLEAEGLEACAITPPENLEFDTLRISRDVTLRWAYCAPEDRPVRNQALLLHGRTESIEKYYETLKDLNDRGYEVWTFDWRGQGLSSRMTNNRQKGHVRRFEHYLYDLRHFIDQVIPPRNGKRRLLMAHSMGGHIALHHLLRYPDDFDDAVLLAPMTDIRMGPLMRTLARTLSRTMMLNGLGRAYMPGQRDWSQRGFKTAKPLLSACEERHQRNLCYLKQNPALRIGGVTASWLNGALGSAQKLKAKAQQVGQLHARTLIVLGEKEFVVSNAATRDVAKILGVTPVVIENARHEVLQDNDELRAEFWQLFDKKFK